MVVTVLWICARRVQSRRRRRRRRDTRRQFSRDPHDVGCRVRHFSTVGASKRGQRPPEGRSMSSEFDELAAARTAHLYRSAWLLCGDAHRAEDLVQETLEKVYVRMSRRLAPRWRIRRRTPRPPWCGRSSPPGGGAATASGPRPRPTALADALAGAGAEHRDADATCGCPSSTPWPGSSRWTGPSSSSATSRTSRYRVADGGRARAVRSRSIGPWPASAPCWARP